MNWRKAFAAVLLAAVAICVMQTVAQAQCSMCVTALENSPEGKRLAASFNNGILFLMVIPYGLFTTIGVVVYRAHRRKKIAAREAENPYIPKSN